MDAYFHSFCQFLSPQWPGVPWSAHQYSCLQPASHRRQGRLPLDPDIWNCNVEDLESTRKCFIYWCTQHTLFMVIWCWTYGKKTTQHERKPAATIWAIVLCYAPSHRQDSTYYSLCFTSCGALAGMRNSSMGPQWGIDLTTHSTMSRRSYHGVTLTSWNQHIL